MPVEIGHYSVLNTRIRAIGILIYTYMVYHIVYIQYTYTEHVRCNLYTDLFAVS